VVGRDKKRRWKLLRVADEKLWRKVAEESCRGKSRMEVLATMNRAPSVSDSSSGSCGGQSRWKVMESC
jgi:hypothetical protein